MMLYSTHNYVVFSHFKLPIDTNVLNSLLVSN